MERTVCESEEMKKTPWILKVFIAGIAAFIVLNLFSILYYNIPARTAVPDDSTEYKWPANAFHSLATEGLAWGRVNNDGYNNMEDLADDKDIDILIMGSSHAEGFNVAKDRNIASVLNAITDRYAYNIGISEHTLLKCLANLENALKAYQPRDAVVIETMTVSFYDDEIRAALSGENRLPTYSGGIMDILQKMKYLKLVFYQYNNLKPSSAKGDKALNDEELLNDILSRAAELCTQRDVELIIVFHPTLSVDNEDNITTSYSREDAKLLEKVCMDNGITFINMEDDFREYYLSEHKLPHGFNNTVPGQGHLNETGHMLMAYAVKDVLEVND